ncbi:metallophosphoesterase family protein [Sedimenticola hydrogenitrophicus]|uniref:metallophosphoesterase family protein n=1 Tax=Sedimenticola hydrogenitrophicus TaxID=2967975 RepID=UPI0021A461E3|nr:metallophosphoesterase family protein [Sedimenticola hydrogenitrophicus]
MILGIFSDAHGNAGGFCCARDLMYSNGAKQLYYLGDAVGYVPLPDVVRELRATPEILPLRGNHEKMLLADNGADTEKAKVYRYDMLRSRLTTDDLNFLASLASLRRVEIDGKRLLFVHGSPSEPTTGYVYPDSSLKDFANVDADVIFMGHTHHPFVRREYGRLFVNVGSCGLPRDTDPRGCAALFDTSSNEVTMLRYSLAASSEVLLKTVEVAAPVARLLQSYVSCEESS